MLIVREIFTKRDKKHFFKFPIELYKDSPYFVPTMIADEMEEFDPKKNGAFEYAECRLFVAERDGKMVGRVAAILNHSYNQKVNAKQMRISRFDFTDDNEVVDALFAEVRKWAKECGMNEIIGPIGFSDLDKQGLLTEGFDQMDMYITPYNHEYYVRQYERLGMTKKAEWVEYQIFIPKVMDERLDRVADAAIERYGYKVHPFTNIKQIKPYIPAALQVMNEAFEKLFGVVWLTDKQLIDYSKLIMLIGNVDYITLVMNKENEVIGYGFMAPSISRAIRLNRGRLTPIGLLRIMHDLKHSKTIDLYSIGVKPEYQNKGVNAIILRNNLRGAIKNGMTLCETGPELEDNTEVQSQWRMFERKVHKRRRCYSISI